MDSLQKKQRGATLLVSLVLLLLLTLIGFASARTAMLQQRMSSNLQQQTLAFQAAENGIKAAILRLESADANKKWPSRDTTKSLCGTESNFADWDSCPLSAENKSQYRVDIKQISCSAPSSGFICFDILSKGTYNTSSSTHKQGYIFELKASD